MPRPDDGLRGSTGISNPAPGEAPTHNGWGDIWSGINKGLDGLTGLGQRYFDWKRYTNPVNPRSTSQPNTGGSTVTPTPQTDPQQIESDAQAKNAARAQWIAGIENKHVMIAAGGMLALLVLMR